MNDPVGNDPLGAFIRRFEPPIGKGSDGPLAGRTFAAKDLFDIEGYVTGAGNPDWAADHPAPSSTAVAVSRLLAAGALLTGKVHTDELAFSLNGENAHFGTPLNSAAPDRVPGGSSSGSVSAVAGGAVDFAIGTDTGGSVRLPASYCGVWGMRPSHGRVPVDGLVPLAPGFDTVGWFARDAGLLDAVGDVLLDRDGDSGEGGFTAPEVLWPVDFFALLTPSASAVLRARLSAFLPPSARITEITLADDSDGPQGWLGVFQKIQWYEAWRSHGAWISSRKPAFGPGIADRFEGARSVTEDTYKMAMERRGEITRRLTTVLGKPGSTLLALPVAPGPAPLKNLPQDTLNAFRAAALTCLCPAGLGRLPEVSIPGAKVDGLPVGLGLVGPSGSDRALLAFASKQARNEGVS